MPPEAISMPATLYLYADRVRIVAGRYEVNHPRKFVAHEGSTLAAHRAAMVAAVSGKRGKRYLKRQQLLELGEPAFLYLTEIVHRRPGQWFHDIDRLHNILQSHRSEEHTSELQSQSNLVCRLLLEKKNKNEEPNIPSTTCIANKYVLITIAHILDDAVLKACMLL